MSFAGQERGGTQVADEVGEAGVGVEPAGGRHDVGRCATEVRRLETGLRVPVDRRPPSLQAHEHDHAGPEPSHEAFHPLGARPVLGGLQVLRPRRRPLDQVGHAHTVDEKRVEWVARPGQQPGVGCGRPEAIGRAREPEPGVGGHEAGVEPAEQHSHPGADGVGQRAQAADAALTESLEARTGDGVLHPLRMGGARELGVEHLARRRGPVEPGQRNGQTYKRDGAQAVHPRSLAYVPVDLTVRERILEAGYACVARYGLAKTTVEDVARAARLSRATLYRHFPGGRDQLMREVIAWETGRFFGRLAEAVAGAPDFARLLEEALVFAHRAVEEHAVLQKVLQTEPERLLPQLTVDIERILVFIRGFLVPYLEREQLAPGVDAEQAADYVARMLLSFIGNQGRWDLTDPSQVSRLVRTELLAGVLQPQGDR